MVIMLFNNGRPWCFIGRSREAILAEIRRYQDWKLKEKDFVRCMSLVEARDLDIGFLDKGITALENGMSVFMLDASTMTESA